MSVMWAGVRWVDAAPSLIYAVISALFRDAKLADLIEQSPCVLDERQLGPVTDKDPEWRNAAVFTHEEVETIISDARIPPDRQMVYGLELLAGVRPGEAAALRWRHYEPRRGNHGVGPALEEVARDRSGVGVAGRRAEDLPRGSRDPGRQPVA
jgi:integrase